MCREAALTLDLEPFVAMARVAADETALIAALEVWNPKKPRDEKKLQELKKLFFATNPDEENYRVRVCLWVGRRRVVVPPSLFSSPFCSHPPLL